MLDKKEDAGMLNEPIKHHHHHGRPMPPRDHRFNIPSRDNGHFNKHEPSKGYCNDGHNYFGNRGYNILGNTFIEPPIHEEVAKRPPIIREEIPTLINIETNLVLSLKMRLYRVREEDDQELTLELGKKYTVKYITECGVNCITGVLKTIDPTIPQEDLSYICNGMPTGYGFFLIFDCSTEGNSAVHKIYVAAIRDICEYVEPTEDEEPENPDTGDTEENPDDNTDDTENPTETPEEGGDNTDEPVETPEDNTDNNTEVEDDGSTGETTPDDSTEEVPEDTENPTETEEESTEEPVE